MNAPGNSASMTPVKQALAEIRNLRARLAEAESSRREPIAIVGMGIRFPGDARDADSFGDLLWSATRRRHRNPAATLAGRRALCPRTPTSRAR